ncbi:MAG TPA: dehydratase [Roseiarcus sp.]|nr:dehydratase [Roseiarcus sp.]
MFYEDMTIGAVTELGSTRFTREAIVAYAEWFDPRVLAFAAAREDGLLVASGLHVASALMRRLVDTRTALRTEMAGRGEVLPELGVSPGFREMRWPRPVREGDVVRFVMTTVSKRETAKPPWGLVGSSFRGVNQRGEAVLTFSSVVLAARRMPKS